MPWNKLFVILVLILFLYVLFTIGSPFLLALLMAVFLEPFVGFLVKRTFFNRTVSAVIACTLFTIALLGMTFLIGLKIVSETVNFTRNISSHFNVVSDYSLQIAQQAREFLESLSIAQADRIEESVQNSLSGVIDSLGNLLGQISFQLLNLAKFVPTLLIYYLVFTVALYLFSLSLPMVKRIFLSLFEETTRSKMEVVLVSLRRSVIGFLKAQVILSSLTYIVSLIGLVILDVDYPLVIALIIIIVDILPVLGTGSVLVPWALFSLVILDDAKLGIGLIILFVAITVFRRILEPKVIGASVGIGALSTLISIYVGFQLVGAIGLLLGPMLVIVYQALRSVGLLEFKIKLE